MVPESLGKGHDPSTNGTGEIPDHIPFGTPEPGVPPQGEDGHSMVSPQSTRPAPDSRPIKPNHLIRNAIASETIAKLRIQPMVSACGGFR